jgi:hypothetical protein
MTALAPNPEGTTGSLPITVPTPARHRTAHPAAEGPPAWLQLAATIAAVAFGWFALLQWRDPAAPLLLVVALLIAVAALALDVAAALTARRTGDA